MTIKTLEFIHGLLNEEVTKRNGAYQLIKKCANEARENDQPNADALSEQEEIAWDKRIEAIRARDEFEQKEW